MCSRGVREANLHEITTHFLLCDATAQCANLIIFHAVQRGLVLKLHMMSPIASLESAKWKRLLLQHTTTFQRKLPGASRVQQTSICDIVHDFLEHQFLVWENQRSVLCSTSSKCNWQMKQRSGLAHMEVGACPTHSDNSFAFLNVPYMLHIHHCNLAFRCMQQQDTHHTQREARSAVLYYNNIALEPSSLSRSLALAQFTPRDTAPSHNLSSR